MTAAQLTALKALAETGYEWNKSRDVGFGYSGLLATLVRLGYAESRKSETYRRARKRYRVTNAGRAALAANEKIA